MPPGAQGGFDEEPLSGRSVENARFGTQPPFSTQATSFNRKRVSISSFQPVRKIPGRWLSPSAVKVNVLGWPAHELANRPGLRRRRDHLARAR